MKAASHGQKLRRWLISIMVLIFWSLISSIWASSYDKPFISDPGYRLIKLSGGLIAFLSGVHQLVWWHVADLLDRNRQQPSSYAWLASYGAFLMVYAVRMAAIGMGASGVWDTNVPCGGILLVLFQSCVGPPISLSMTISCFSLATYFLCLAKTVAAIRSRRSP